MASVSVTVVNAFTDQGLGGNPAGVVLGADALTGEQKLHIAKQVGLSETVFVSRSEQAACKLEFFTPARQIAHCGHATVAAFSLLRQRGLVADGASSKETIDGLRKIEIDGDLIFMEQKAPHYTDLPESVVARVLATLRIGRGALAQGAAPCVANTGNAFLMLPMADAAELAALRPDFGAVSALCDTLGLVGYYPFARDAQDSGRQAITRMFAPLYDIDEEAATGTAAGPLACFLYDRAGERRAVMQIEQGQLMAPPSPSVLTARLQLAAGGIEGVYVGGRGSVGAELRIEL